MQNVFRMIKTSVTVFKDFLCRCPIIAPGEVNFSGHPGPDVPVAFVFHRRAGTFTPGAGGQRGVADAGPLLFIGRRRFGARPIGVGFQRVSVIVVVGENVYEFHGFGVGANVLHFSPSIQIAVSVVGLAEGRNFFALVIPITPLANDYAIPKDVDQVTISDGNSARRSRRRKTSAFFPRVNIRIFLGEVISGGCDAPFSPRTPSAFCNFITALYSEIS